MPAEPLMQKLRHLIQGLMILFKNNALLFNVNLVINIYSGTDRWASRTRAFHHQTAEGAELLSPGEQNLDGQFGNLSL